MKIDAKRAFLSSNHLIARLGNRVIAVTGDALSKLFLIERSFVRTRLKQFSLTRMTLAADIGDRSYARWRRAMITVAIVAGRGRQILFLVQSLRMNAGLVFDVLIAWNPEAAHVVRTGMALRAGLGDVSWIN